MPHRAFGCIAAMLTSLLLLPPASVLAQTRSKTFLDGWYSGTHVRVTASYSGFLSSVSIVAVNAPDEVFVFCNGESARAWIGGALDFTGTVDPKPADGETVKNEFGGCDPRGGSATLTLVREARAAGPRFYVAFVDQYAVNIAPAVMSRAQMRVFVKAIEAAAAQLGTWAGTPIAAQPSRPPLGIRVDSPPVTADGVFGWDAIAVYMLPACPTLRVVPKGSLVHFKSAADAERAGYRRSTDAGC